MPPGPTTALFSPSRVESALQIRAATCGTSECAVANHESHSIHRYGVLLIAHPCRSQQGNRRDADTRYAVGPQEGFLCVVL